jgi:UDP-2,3-diacylglucosamine hydrolase
MSRDALWCVADPHFTEEDPALRTFQEFLRLFREEEVPCLVLLGDFFSVWIGGEGIRAPHQDEVTRSLAALREEGRTVVYLIGNRDYLLESLAPSPFDILAEDWDWAAEGGRPRIHFEHGDRVNTSDEAYLRWRLFSRSGSVLTLFRSLPPAVQDRLAKGIRSRMKGSNRSSRNYEPRAEMARWARSLADSGYDAAVLGHFHLDKELQEEGLRIRLVPRFREEGAHLRIRADGTWELARIR